MFLVTERSSVSICYVPVCASKAKIHLSFSTPHQLFMHCMSIRVCTGRPYQPKLQSSQCCSEMLSTHLDELDAEKQQTKLRVPIDASSSISKWRLDCFPCSLLWKYLFSLGCSGHLHCHTDTVLQNSLEIASSFFQTTKPVIHRSTGQSSQPDLALLPLIDSREVTVKCHQRSRFQMSHALSRPTETLFLHWRDYKNKERIVQ